MRQRVAARLLLASCTLALGLGLGMAIALVGVTDLVHPSLTVRPPGQASGALDRGVHQLLVSRTDPGGEPPVSESRPACTVTDARTRAQAPAVPPDTGFAAVRVERDGHHLVSCTSAIPVTVLVRQEGEPLTSYLAVIGRALLVAVLLTVMAVLIAARALMTVRRMRSSPPPADGGGEAPS